MRRQGGRPEREGPQQRIARIALYAGPLAAIALYALLPNSYDGPAGRLPLPHAARATLAMALWMAVWWMGEALPLAATALLPLAMFPLLGVATGRDAAAPYGHELIFLFLGGFLIALAMERWGLHERFAVRALDWVGTRPARLVGGFMAVSALLSMWVSNTATAIMMLPVALSVVGSEPEERDSPLAVCLLLGIAYGCSIGGVATPIGTPPNVFLLSFLRREVGVDISFARWMGFGVPLVLLFLPVAWWVLTRLAFRLDAAPLASAARLQAKASDLGPMGRGERSAALVFCLAATAWIARPLLNAIEVAGTRPLAGLSDTAVAVGAGLLLFLLPGGRNDGDQASTRALDWETALRLPWGILILFGGGLSLAAAIRANGVDSFIGHQVVALHVLPAGMIVVGVVALLVFVTELTSNTATTAAFVPLLAGIAPGLGMPPALLAVPAAVAASFAFMLPVATPPNAVVFGSGLVPIGAMSRAGLMLNLLAIVLIPVVTFAIAVPLFRIH